MIVTEEARPENCIFERELAKRWGIPHYRLSGDRYAGGRNVPMFTQRVRGSQVWYHMDDVTRFERVRGIEVADSSIGFTAPVATLPIAAQDPAQEPDSPSGIGTLVEIIYAEVERDLRERIRDEERARLLAALQATA